MNVSVKLLRSAVFSSLLCLVLPLPLEAATIYSYTGNPYSNVAPSFCNGTYTSGCTGLAVTGSFTTASPLAANLSVYTVIPTSFSFTDGAGVFSLTSSTALAISTLWVSTNTLGNIVDWNIQLATNPADCNPSPSSLECLGSYYNGTFGTPSDFSAYSFQPSGFFGAGNNQNSPGSWVTTTAASATPEPSSLVLLGTGLGFVVTMGYRMRASHLHRLVSRV